MSYLTAHSLIATPPITSVKLYDDDDDVYPSISFMIWLFFPKENY